ncbi:hypothetical protein E5Q_05264 [Mixia osmundae IAM 14324]|uniref:Uncharacterized protein n=1 Tax=Mixia osmundae (strain CBS 9802 / IAM 14324 / JCM 22182 / KY 12970) TaxID=764103 RepID=G7E6W7_MIXOS|nr:hypothetical protein E5Q_05264 [Mixia osmundae IAM 14324]
MVKRKVDGLDGSTLPPARLMAANEKSVRSKALEAMAIYLANGAQDEREDLSSSEGSEWEQPYKPDSRLKDAALTTLWKGVFYSFWMSDKPIAQQADAAAIANLVLAIRPKRVTGRAARTRCALRLLQGFWTTVREEWRGIDRLRTDKYYMLIRNVLRASFLLLAREQWDLHAIREHNELLRSESCGPLRVDSNKTPLGVSYHVASIYLEELDTALRLSSSEEDETKPALDLLELLEPLLQAMDEAPTKAVFVKLREFVVDPLIHVRSVDKVDEVPSSNRARTSEDADPQSLSAYPILFAALQHTPSVQEVRLTILRALFARGARDSTSAVARHRYYAICAESEVAEDELAIA